MFVIGSWTQVHLCDSFVSSHCSNSLLLILVCFCLYKFCNCDSIKHLAGLYTLNFNRFLHYFLRILSLDQTMLDACTHVGLAIDSMAGNINSTAHITAKIMCNATTSVLEWYLTAGVTYLHGGSQLLAVVPTFCIP